MNIPGYGPSRVWVPPILKPTSILAVLDKYSVVEGMSYGPLSEALDSWWHNLGSKDSWDGYWYNNAEASGSQLYPIGLAKYFDLHSFNGAIEYLWYYLW
jgi:hypothetical protein